ncbi:MAG: DUF4157 domain-containing protein [Rhodanobacter lindaniclasticus]
MGEHSASVAAKPAEASRAAGLLLQRKCACGTHAPAEGECASCKRRRMQRKSAGERSVEAIPASVHRVLQSSGEPLDPRTRTAMESGFGQDFSHVRVHRDSAAAESAHAVSALAYTVGHDVVFARGQYAPGTTMGRHLIAHELAHTVQQTHLPDVPVGVSDPGSALERQADHAADRVVSGRPVGALPRARVPLIARELDTRDMTASDGGIDHVTREVTPGKCALAPETRTSTSGDITASTAFLQLDLCHGSTAGQVRGEVDYGDALKQAGQAVGKLLSNAASGQGSQQALGTFADDLKQLQPGAKIRMNLQASDVFKLDLTGTGNASVAGGATGKATARAEFDTGPVNLVVEGSVAGGNQQQTSYDVTVSIEFGGRRLQAPDCRACQCTDPKISFACSHVPPKGARPPAPPPSAAKPTRYIPYFFKYAETAPTPNKAMQTLSDNGLQEAVNLLLGGYRIARIEGSASPEGPEKKERGSFKNNTVLAKARAEQGKRLLDERIKKNLDGLMIMRSEPLKQALAASYPVVGRAELFGTDASGKEVADPALMSHLRDKLAAPAEGQPDPLAQEHVIGAGLSVDAQSADQADVDAFRTGRRGDRRLSRDERLQAIYEPLRRALIVLEPPPQPPPDLRLSQKDIENVIGAPVDCTDKNKALFANVPIAKPFEGECKAPGKQGGSSK